jgi:hypothetical protein
MILIYPVPLLPALLPLTPGWDGVIQEADRRLVTTPRLCPSLTKHRRQEIA